MWIACHFRSGMSNGAILPREDFLSDFTLWQACKFVCGCPRSPSCRQRYIGGGVFGASCDYPSVRPRWHRGSWRRLLRVWFWGPRCGRQATTSHGGRMCSFVFGLVYTARILQLAGRVSRAAVSSLPVVHRQQGVDVASGARERVCCGIGGPWDVRDFHTIAFDEGHPAHLSWRV